MLRILYATYASPESFLEHVYADDGKSMLGVSTKAEFAEGEEAILEIGFPGLPNRILVRASAVLRAHGGSDPRKWFHIAGPEEVQLYFLLAVATGRADASVQRRHRRFPLRMDAKVKMDGVEGAEVKTAQTSDMATSGVALETDEALPDGARVTVVLNPGDGLSEIEIAGTVRWNRPSEDQTAEVGIQFEKTHTEDTKRLRQLIRGVKISGQLGVE